MAWPPSTGAGAAVFIIGGGWSRGDESAGFSDFIFVPLSMLSKSGLGVPPGKELRDY